MGDFVDLRAGCERLPTNSVRNTLVDRFVRPLLNKLKPKLRPGSSVIVCLGDNSHDVSFPTEFAETMSRIYAQGDDHAHTP
jgi:hypothetical protein